MKILSYLKAIKLWNWVFELTIGWFICIFLVFLPALTGLRLGWQSLLNYTTNLTKFLALFPPKRYFFPNFQSKFLYKGIIFGIINQHFVNHPGLTSQRHSALISSDWEYFQVCFSAVHNLKVSDYRWIGSEKRWKRKFSEQRTSALNTADSFWNNAELLLFWTALIQWKSELISSETELISADVFHFLWISAEKRQISKTALFSADYLWDFNPWCHKTFWKVLVLHLKLNLAICAGKGKKSSFLYLAHFLLYLLLLNCWKWWVWNFSRISILFSNTHRHWDNHIGFVWALFTMKLI